MKKIILGLFLISSLSLAAGKAGDSNTYIKGHLIGASAEFTKNDSDSLEYGFGVSGGLLPSYYGSASGGYAGGYGMVKFNFNLQNSKFTPYVALRAGVGFYTYGDSNVRASGISIFPSVGLGTEYGDSMVFELGYPGTVSVGLKF